MVDVGAATPHFALLCVMMGAKHAACIDMVPGFFKQAQRQLIGIFQDIKTKGDYKDLIADWYSRLKIVEA